MPSAETDRSVQQTTSGNDKKYQVDNTHAILHAFSSTHLKTSRHEWWILLVSHSHDVFGYISVCSYPLNIQPPILTQKNGIVHDIMTIDYAFRLYAFSSLNDLKTQKASSIWQFIWTLKSSKGKKKATSFRISALIRLYPPFF